MAAGLRPGGLGPVHAGPLDCQPGHSHWAPCHQQQIHWGVCGPAPRCEGPPAGAWCRSWSRPASVCFSFLLWQTGLGPLGELAQPLCLLISLAQPPPPAFLRSLRIPERQDCFPSSQIKWQPLIKSKIHSWACQSSGDPCSLGATGPQGSFPLPPLAGVTAIPLSPLSEPSCSVTHRAKTRGFPAPLPPRPPPSSLCSILSTPQTAGLLSLPPVVNDPKPALRDTIHLAPWMCLLAPVPMGLAHVLPTQECLSMSCGDVCNSLLLLY